MASAHETEKGLLNAAAFLGWDAPRLRAIAAAQTATRHRWQERLAKRRSMDFSTLRPLDEPLSMMGGQVLTGLFLLCENAVFLRKKIDFHVDDKVGFRNG
ncbi:MAG: hypothetical protein GY822_25740 [Deltaproteobacteria bacterium]|nr:hypothetical protein [Deltaproteobacteria bacterium]